MSASESNAFMRGLLHARVASGVVMSIRSSSNPMDALYWMLPALAHMSHTDRWSVWLAPPFRPESGCFRNMGFNLTHTRIVHSSGDEGCAVELIEQALRCPANAVILAWPKRVNGDEVSRLQRAASEGSSFGLLFLSDESDTTPTTCRHIVDPGAGHQLMFDMKQDLTSHSAPSY